MADTVDTETVETEPQEAKDNTEATSETDDLERWKALSRKNEKRAKENAEAAKQLEAVTAENATLHDKLKQLEQELAQYRSEHNKQDWAQKAAKKHNVPTEALMMLSADTEEDMMAQAEMLAKLVNKPVPVVQGDGNHTESKMSSEVQQFAKQLFNR